MPLTDYVTLGRSGLAVSPVCLGTATFGTEWNVGAPPEVAYALMDRYFEKGGNFLDTANLYNRGHAEKIIGDHVGHVPSRRDRIVISTKFSLNGYPGDPNGGGASRKSILRACEQSLRRLRTDYIDIYWQHWEDPFTHFEETLRTLDDLVASGKVRYIGLSNTAAWKVAQAQTVAAFRGWAPVIAVQVEHSLIERTAETEVMPMAAALGIGVVAWAPLAGGVLSGKYSAPAPQAAEGRAQHVAGRLTEGVNRIVQQIQEVAERVRVSGAQVALAWSGAHSGTTVSLIGARTIEQLDANLAAFDLVLSASDIELLNSISVPMPTVPTKMYPRLWGGSHGGININRQFSPATYTTVLRDEDVF